MKIPPQFIVVDDDPINNLVCKYNIASLAPAAHIQLFTDPENALAWIREEYSQKPDSPETVLFLDINMPVMNGWEFLDEFSSLPDSVHTQISIFILSSSIDPEDKQNAENHPLVRGYYSKPLSKETINQIYMEG
ncbi:response regulator [Dyadobacter sp. CY323]|uniref:response regulator n=1 Tax=Dyadobacter sp. CY323 TaxID=2907302 RepID=UPI001F255542|nr:response regulator [Dyadobacter sp. CY323]MCE6989677.1 response regulator [Dyadobacter sp. CY323]